MSDWELMLIGVAIGWFTKAPFLYKYYKRIREDREWLDKMNEKVKQDLAKWSKHALNNGTIQ